MKKILFKTIGFILVAACLFGVVCVGENLSDILKCKSSWEKLGEESEENLTLLGNGIDQLSENTDTYRDGAKTYEESLVQYEEGKKTLEEAKATLEAGKKKYKTGVGSYYSGKATYEKNVASVNEAKEKVAAGEAQLAANEQAYLEGKETLAANKEAYEAGKAQLAEAEPIYNIVKPVDEVANSTGLGGITNITIRGYSIGGIVDEYEAGEAQIKQYEDGQAQVQAYEDGQKQIAESKATIAEYDVKLAEAADKLSAGAGKLADAKKQIESGELQISDGEALLADAEKQLADGKAKLGQYEDGEAQLADGLTTAMSADTYYTDDGQSVIPSIKNRLGSGFTFYETDSTGNVVKVNGVDFVSIDKAREVLDTGWDFYNDTVAGVSNEIIGRVVCILLAAAACLVGIFAGVGTFTDHKVLTAIAAGISAIAGIAAYTYISVVSSGNTYAFSKHVGSEGHGYLALAVGIVALASVLTCAIGFLTNEKKAAKVAISE